MSTSEGFTEKQLQLDLSFCHFTSPRDLNNIPKYTGTVTSVRTAQCEHCSLHYRLTFRPTNATDSNNHIEYENVLFWLNSGSANIHAGEIYIYQSGVTFYSPVVTICTTRFNIHKSYLPTTQCINVFPTVPSTKCDYFLKN
jgi:hypothetical protein